MTRDELEAVAMAIGICKVPLTPLAPQSECYAVRDRSGNWRAFDPRNDDGDCARMENALRINTEWPDETDNSDFVVCLNVKYRAAQSADFSDHGGDRGKARRAAACAVAVRVARGMGK